MFLFRSKTSFETILRFHDHEGSFKSQFQSNKKKSLNFSLFFLHVYPQCWITRLKPGGKPSTWYPPGGALELDKLIPVQSDAGGEIYRIGSSK